mgnify:CR=1 FL=1
MLIVLTPQGLRQQTDADDGDDENDDEDAQENREEDRPPAFLHVGLHAGGSGDWRRPARWHPPLSARGSVRARMIVFAHESFVSQGSAEEPTVPRTPGRRAASSRLALGTHHEDARQRGHALASAREAQAIRRRRRHCDRASRDLAHDGACLW